MNIQPFSCSSPAITVAATAAALTAVALPLSKGNVTRIVNEGPNIVFIALGALAVLATLPTTGNGTGTSTPVLVGEDVVFSRNPDVELYISTICRAAGTATLTVQCGEGQ